MSKGNTYSTVPNRESYFKPLGPEGSKKFS